MEGRRRYIEGDGWHWQAAVCGGGGELLSAVACCVAPVA